MQIGGKKGREGGGGREGRKGGREGGKGEREGKRQRERDGGYETHM